MQIANKNFDFYNNTYIMGIVNLSKESFYQHSYKNNIDSALKYIETSINHGADIMDIGAQSTKPNYVEISAEEEIERLGNIVSECKKRFNIAISVDTYKHKVAEEALKCGADMINDVFGLNYESGKLASVVSKYNACLCIMNNKEIIKMDNCIEAVIKGLKRSLKIASDNNISKDKIIIDPGIGFGKSPQQNIEIIKNISQIQKSLNYPILLGASNKSFIPKTLNLSSEANYDGANIAISVYASLQNVGIVRVHNVKDNKLALKMIKTIKNGCANAKN